VGYKVKLLPIVYQDLRKARKWYNDQQESLGEEFKEEINKEIDYIGHYPEHYQCKYKELRQSLIARFSYAIFYLLEEDKKQVIVFGILHTSRNPEIASKRIRR
jgi:plasmid stabilization system protein ParE